MTSSCPSCAALQERIKALTEENKGLLSRVDTPHLRYPADNPTAASNEAPSCKPGAHDIRGNTERCACGMHTRDHLVLVNVMNALDIYMPPDGMALLKEIRTFAARVGYPWEEQEKSLPTTTEPWRTRPRPETWAEFYGPGNPRRG